MKGNNSKRMKANGVPEKLYLLPNGLISYCRNNNEDTEYICKDVVIEKVAGLLNYMLSDVVAIRQPGTIIETHTTKIAFIEEFKQAMKL